VVHVGTFSKTLAPSLRLGYLVVPAWLQPSVLRVRAALGSPASSLAQLAVAAFMRSGGFRRHLARSRREYRRRRSRLAELIEPYRPALNLHGLDAGLHAVLELPADADETAVTGAAARDGVLVAPLGDYAVPPPPDLPPAIVLGYGDATDDDLRRAVDTIAAHLGLPRTAAG
jgi:GntR family transcriptional regulator/MocR family aminotransferase